MAKSRLRCCIQGCLNTPQSIYNNEPINFYSFPLMSVHTPWKREKRELWIRAVKRYTKNPSNFEPKKSTKICSAHFIGNKKSEHPHHPAYVPTIFSEKRDKRRGEQSIARFNRQQDRQRQKELLYHTINCDSYMDITQLTPDQCSLVLMDSEEIESPASTEENMKQDFSCQVDLQGDSNSVDSDDIPVLFCTLRQINGNQSAEVQTNINIRVTQQKGIQVDIPIENKIMKNASCDPLDTNLYVPECPGFHGTKSIKNDEQMSSLTGVSITVFLFLVNYLHSLRGYKLSPKTKLLITLMKLKTGLSYTALSVIFCIHPTIVQRSFVETLQCLSVLTKNFIFWPSRETIKATLPEAFKIHYPDTRVIIDCTEARTEIPSSAIKNQVLMYSQYKHNHTAKFLIGCTPSGFISFVSKCYGGRAGDCFITLDSGIIDLLEPGDYVLADKGFPNIRVQVENKNAIFVMPPFLQGDQFSAEEVQQSYNIASVRIHVERVIQRVKEFYIFQKIPIHMLPHIDQIVSVVCALINLEKPIIQKKD